MIFPVHGPVAVDSPHYRHRGLDERMRTAIERGDYVNLFGGRQTGKTSIVFRLRRISEEQGAASAYIDASLLVDGATDRRVWFRSFHDSLRASMLPDEVRSRLPEPPEDVLQFPAYICRIVQEVAPRRPLIIFLDEVTAVPESLRQPFFANIRGMFNQRTEVAGAAEARDIIFVFVGTFDPGHIDKGSELPVQRGDKLLDYGMGLFS